MSRERDEETTLRASEPGPVYRCHVIHTRPHNSGYPKTHDFDAGTWVQSLLSVSRERGDRLLATRRGVAKSSLETLQINAVAVRRPLR